MEVPCKLLGVVWNKGLDCCSHLVHPLLQKPNLHGYKAGWVLHVTGLGVNKVSRYKNRGT